MSLSNELSHLSTNELVKSFKAATLHGQPPKELVLELARRPGIAFIQATDSTKTTLEKAYTAIRQIEQNIDS